MATAPRKPIPKTIGAFEKYAREQLETRGIQVLTLESLHWFEREVKKAIKTATLSNVKQFGVQRESFRPGQLVLYQYDPKTKEELPIYDTMPLILVTSVGSKGWTGVNLHYIPPRIRTWILNQLYDNNVRKGIIEKDRIKFSWQIALKVAAAVGSTKHLNNSIKRYLASHTKSKPLIIDAAYWDLIVYLPLARFKKGKPY